MGFLVATQRWIDNWRVETCYEEFYSASGSVRVKRKDSYKTYMFEDWLALEAAGKTTEA
jgi:hypothetical protein